MARPRTIRRVHAAVMSLAERGGPGTLTMEGIAAEAGVGKQTLYRSWPSVHAILFDALASESIAATWPEDVTVVDLLQATADEIHTEPRCTLLRALAASIQTDAAVAQEFRERLLEPQLGQITEFVAAAGYAAPRQSAELLLAPIVYRWMLRMPPLRPDELKDHAARIHALSV